MCDMFDIFQKEASKGTLDQIKALLPPQPLPGSFTPHAGMPEDNMPPANKMPEVGLFHVPVCACMYFCILLRLHVSYVLICAYASAPVHMQGHASMCIHCSRHMLADNCEYINA